MGKGGYHALGIGGALFISYKLLNGTSKTISDWSLIRIRPTIFEFEPNSVVMIQADIQQSYCSEDFEMIVKRFASSVPLARLTMLDGTPVSVSANRVFEVRPPSPAIHNPKATAIVQFGTVNGSGPLEGVFTSVIEPIDVVQGRLNSAYA